MPGTSGARLRMVMPENTTITATHSHAHATEAPGSSTSFNAQPTRNSCTAARAQAHRMERERCSRCQPERPTAIATSTSEAASPAHPMWVELIVPSSARRRSVAAR